MQLELPVTIDQPASWVIAHRATGRAVQEVFGPCPALAPVLAAAYEVVAISDWLHRVNMNARRACA